MSTINTLIKAALDDIYLANPSFLYTINRSDVEIELQQALDNVIPNDISLSMDKPDYEAIYLQCAQALQDKPLWKDFVPSAVGQTLLRNIVSGITYLETSIIRATQVAFMQPGTPKSSVYQIMSSQGINPRRKLPAKLPVRIRIPDHQGSFVIPKFTNFKIKDTNFFNRTDIVYTEFELEKDVNLVQGTKFSQDGVADGNPYEKVEIGYENFLISDEDVYVNVNGVAWDKSKAMPWNSKNLELVYFTKTLETGNVEVMFGNDIFGKQLNNNDNVEIIWFETNGSSVDAVEAGLSIEFVLNTGAPIVVTTIGSLFGMDDELSIDFYINMGPNMRAAENGAVRRIDFPVVGCRYPNVRDLLSRGQAELAPHKRNWMNIVELTPLTADTLPMQNPDWEKFVEYMTTNSMGNLEFLRRDPFIIPLVIKAKIHCSDSSSLQLIKAVKEVAIKNFNPPRRGAIGYSLYKSDIIQHIEGSGVEYITQLELSYAPGFDSTTLPPHSGFDVEGNIIADYYSYIAIRNVEFTPVYTPRRSQSGRRDFNIGQS